MGYRVMVDGALVVKRPESPDSTWADYIRVAETVLDELDRSGQFEDCVECQIDPEQDKDAPIQTDI